MKKLFEHINGNQFKLVNEELEHRLHSILLVTNPDPNHYEQVICVCETPKDEQEILQFIKNQGWKVQSISKDMDITGIYLNDVNFETGEDSIGR